MFMYMGLHCSGSTSSCRKIHNFLTGIRFLVYYFSAYVCVCICRGDMGGSVRINNKHVVKKRGCIRNLFKKKQTKGILIAKVFAN